MVENETHFLALCPGLSAEREAMLAELEGVYPGLRVRFGGMTAAERAAAMVFTIPDGRWQGLSGERRRCTRWWAGRCGRRGGDTRSVHWVFSWTALRGFAP